ncbi:Trm112 family protein [Tahibacter amnicola]|uniref:Trm112 family protein n=1 Tax=Tahibacter amnicola TaxID=2976241 RepID=A0ABY6BHK5_9GAMM|nr:hypothetical protein [Tahibacter amnicola]UXI69503.1 hypothetical protein N4264_07600 [Tahibacter amnicola]
MDKRLLDVLCCPVSKTPVTPLSRAQLDALNAAIAGGQVASVAGEKIGTPFAAGLITTDGKVIYRIDDDIPVMLADEAIGTTQLTGFPSASKL